MDISPPAVPTPDDTTYRLELTRSELKITWSALRSMLKDFGHDEPEVHRLVREVLAKMPPEPEMGLIDLHSVLDRRAA